MSRRQRVRLRVLPRPPVDALHGQRRALSPGRSASVFLIAGEQGDVLAGLARGPPEQPVRGACPDRWSGRPGAARHRQYAASCGRASRSHSRAAATQARPRDCPPVAPSRPPRSPRGRVGPRSWAGRRTDRSRLPARRASRSASISRRVAAVSVRGSRRGRRPPAPRGRAGRRRPPGDRSRRPGPAATWPGARARPADRPHHRSTKAASCGQLGSGSPARRRRSATARRAAPSPPRTGRGGGRAGRAPPCTGHRPVTGGPR